MKETELSEVPAGETVKIGNHEMVVLEQSGDTTALIRKELLIERKEFGKNNNYAGSYVDKECCKFAEEISGVVGEDNLVQFAVDLTADDGLKDYGKIKRKAALLTAEQYRRYVDLLDKHKIDAWWWLTTPFSTAKHGNESWVKCVAPSGYFGYSGCGRDFGVRPFCILKSNIFVSF